MSMCPKDHGDPRLGAACDEVAGTFDRSAKGTRPLHSMLLIGMSGGREGVDNGYPAQLQCDSRNPEHPK